MSQRRKDAGLEMGNSNEFVRIIMRIALALLVMSLMVLPLVSPRSPEFMAMIMVLAINGITLAAACLFARRASRK